MGYSGSSRGERYERDKKSTYLIKQINSHSLIKKQDENVYMQKNRELDDDMEVILRPKGGKLKGVDISKMGKSLTGGELK